MRCRRDGNYQMVEGQLDPYQRPVIAEFTDDHSQPPRPATISAHSYNRPSLSSEPILPTLCYEDSERHRAYSTMERPNNGYTRQAMGEYARTG